MVGLNPAEMLERSFSPRPAANEVAYEKLVLLFTSAHCADLHDRHVGVVERVCRVNPNGFAIRDLPHIERILRFVTDKVCEGKVELFSDCLCKLLRTLALPFARRTATDEFKMLNNISSMCHAVSQTFRPEVPNEAQIAAAEMLSEFACAYGARPSVMDQDDEDSQVGPAPRLYHTNQGLLERSGAVQDTVRLGLAQAFGKPESEQDGALQLALVRAALQFSYHAGNAALMVKAGVMDVLCKSLARDFKLEVVFLSLELAWNLLENAPAAAHVALDDAGRESLVSVVTRQVRALLDGGYRAADKEMRNEFLLVAKMLASEERIRLSFFQSGFVKLAVAAAISPEMACEGMALKPFNQTQQAEDLEMKRLAWNLTGELCQNEQCLKEAVGLGLLRSLLMYVDEESAASLAARWPPDQLRDLTLQSLSLMYLVVPHCHAQFSNLDGCRLVMRFVEEARSRDVKMAALRLLRNLASVDKLKTELGQHGAVRLALDLFQDPASEEVVRQDAVAAACGLCKAHEGNQQVFRREGGLDALVGALTQLKSTDQTLPSALAVAVVDCAWAAVAPSRKSLARFLAAHGLDALLDFLESCNPYVFPVVLSCLADMMENPKAHDFFHSWASGVNRQNAAHMILDIWRAEEKARKMVDAQACLTRVARPLAGSVEGRLEWIPSLDMAYTFQSQEKKGVMARMKEVVNGDVICAKVYAVFSKLGFDSLNYLSPIDQSTLCTIEKYVEFKQGEVWQDIAADFESEFLKPTGSDRTRLQSGIDKAEMIARDVVEQQIALNQKYVEYLEADNTMFYNTTMQLAKDEAEAKVYKRSITNLTMKERLEAKLKKEQMLKSSFQKDMTKKNFMEKVDAKIYDSEKDYGPPMIPEDGEGSLGGSP
mmetsp:Transcript_32935/g.63262  ORF Transcript_32935/g.63262 Transcript_32935/m.63262 type:complete len:884 (-) Transcript_32935:291-2942(-)|eukprot:CAMPEP_0114246706 /NCGR_PEP_ID=MMETSP0058-20121206/12621_1 /TAXON_ID=36894 /ORGANISM="Pyramimonas parkeae, CCMP726" /LENGTH=883 /DNA_ID=CAMNT_0001359941 /DNA_START=358 /DNA_END=3009 /DNA_ORIENTATION=+